VARQRSAAWSTVLTLAVGGLLVAGLAMVAIGQLRLGLAEFLAIAVVGSLLGAVLRSGPLRSLGTALMLAGVLIVLLVIAGYVLLVVLGPIARGY
jgi:hypothetical protein